MLEKLLNVIVSGVSKATNGLKHEVGLKLSTSDSGFSADFYRKPVQNSFSRSMVRSRKRKKKKKTKKVRFADEHQVVANTENSTQGRPSIDSGSQVVDGDESRKRPLSSSPAQPEGSGSEKALNQFVENDPFPPNLGQHGPGDFLDNIPQETSLILERYSKRPRNDETAESNLNNVSFMSDDSSFVGPGRSMLPAELQTDGAASDLDLTDDEYRRDSDSDVSRDRESRDLKGAETSINDSPTNRTFYDPELGFVSGDFGDQVVTDGVDVTDGFDAEDGWCIAKKCRLVPGNSPLLDLAKKISENKWWGK